LKDVLQGRLLQDGGDLPLDLAEHPLHVAAVAPAGDQRFTSKRLADRAHAEKLLADIKSKGRIE